MRCYFSQTRCTSPNSRKDKRFDYEETSIHLNVSLGSSSSIVCYPRIVCSRDTHKRTQVR